MSALPYLSDPEIRDIVKPLQQPAAIVRWFLKAGFAGLKVRPNGMPLIARAHFDQVTIGAPAPDDAPKREQPDTAGYLARLEQRKNKAQASR